MNPAGNIIIVSNRGPNDFVWNDDQLREDWSA